MAPQTRSAARTVDPDVIVVHDSDSEPDSARHAPKRQKTRTGHKPVIASSSVGARDMNSEATLRHESSPSLHKGKGKGKAVSQNTQLKGRKRFSADLADIQEECKIGVIVHGLTVKNLRPGDDEGSIEFKILNKDLHHIVSVNFLVSDTSDYPTQHTFFSFSPDPDIPPHILEAIETVSTGRSRSIREAVENLLSVLFKAINPSNQEVDDDEDEGVEGYDAYDVFDDFCGTNPEHKALDLSRLQHDFIETVAAGFRPGFIRFSADDFTLSISIPVITLAQSIPARALMAWDSRLLSRAHYLTLLISGLRGTYPPLEADGTYCPDAVRRSVALRFQVGLCGRYKPGKEEAAEARRTFGLIVPDAEDQARKLAEEAKKAVTDDELMDDAGEEECDGDLGVGEAEEEAEEDEEDETRFDRFSLSSSLESLLDQALVTVIQFRKKFGLGWAGAEMLLAEVEKSQTLPADIFATKHKQLADADKAEAKLARSYELPADPFRDYEKTDEIDLPLTAFSYLIRRLTLCTRYCLVCHNPINTDFEALKPYVCDSKLCAYQYYSLNRGPSLEYEIRTNPSTIDLLVSIAYTAAADQVIDEPLPVGLGLRVPVPAKKALPAPAPTYWYGAPAPAPVASTKVPEVELDGLCDFDELDIWQMRASIAELIDSLPSIEDMKKHLERKVDRGKLKPRLKDMDSSVLPSAWAILRWCVASCTAYLEPISTREDRVRNIDASWKQFRFSVGAPDAEAKFKNAVIQSQKISSNAITYPSLYAFHGSPLKNWHSIIRHGLWFKHVANGRSCGDGVYLAKDGSISMGHYAAGGGSQWRKSKIGPVSCVALAEIVNLPSQFVSSNPYFVVKDTHWIMCRYLLVRGKTSPPQEDPVAEAPAPRIPLVALDPLHPLTLTATDGNKTIQIPQPSHQLEKLLSARQTEYLEEDHDEDDMAIFEATSQPEVIEINGDADDDDVVLMPPLRGEKGLDDWTHDAEWVNGSIAHLMPPPLESTPSATMAVQRELRAMLKEQEAAHSLKDLGWYMPPGLIGDNLFQWIVELHSFDPELPIAKDMIAKHLNSIIFEIRFPPSFPLAPPFFRIITPRFLPFINGGGGHVTGGGSMCMDLLTSDGWLPSYNISAILLQIRLAISNLDPRPARLAADWTRPYSVQESLEGFKRAAASHGWKVPQGLDRLVR